MGNVLEKIIGTSIALIGGAVAYFSPEIGDYISSYTSMNADTANALVLGLGASSALLSGAYTLSEEPPKKIPKTSVQPGQYRRLDRERSLKNQESYRTSA